MREDGSFDPLLKFALGCLVAWVTAKMFWHWLSTQFWHWLSHDVWRWITDHPWWSLLIAVPMALFLALFVIGLFLPDEVEEDDEEPEDEEVPARCALTYKLRQLEAMSPTGFEQACTDLLIRDGFSRARRIGGSGDLGADVIAWDASGRKVVVQCKHYARPVGSKEVQTFNGTARPEHHADVATMVALNGFTGPGADFAARHRITLVDRAALKRWSAGEHLYDVIGEQVPQG